MCQLFNSNLCYELIQFTDKISLNNWWHGVISKYRFIVLFTMKVLVYTLSKKLEDTSILYKIQTHWFFFIICSDLLDLLLYFSHLSSAQVSPLSVSLRWAISISGLQQCFLICTHPSVLLSSLRMCLQYLPTYLPTFSCYANTNSFPVGYFLWSSFLCVITLNV